MLACLSEIHKAAWFRRVIFKNGQVPEYRLKELAGVEAAGEVAEMEWPCRLTPSPLVNRYVVKKPGYARMKGGTDEPADVKLGKRINAVLRMGVTRPANGVPAQFKEVQEAYDVLSDEAKRKHYDELHSAAARSGTGVLAHSR